MPSLAPDAASFDIEISAGVPVEDVESPTHDIRATPGSGGAMRVQLVADKTIPNRDFVLHYRTAGAQISEALLRNTDARGDFFSLTLQPPARVAARETRPKELTWVVDRSGSMDGWPLDAARTLVTRNLDKMRAGDTFNVVVVFVRPRSLFRPSGRGDARKYRGRQALSRFARCARRDRYVAGRARGVARFAGFQTAARGDFHYRRLRR